MKSISAFKISNRANRKKNGKKIKKENKHEKKIHTSGFTTKPNGNQKKSFNI